MGFIPRLSSKVYDAGIKPFGQGCRKHKECTSIIISEQNISAQTREFEKAECCFKVAGTYVKHGLSKLLG